MPLKVKSEKYLRANRFLKKKKEKKRKKRKRKDNRIKLHVHIFSQSDCKNYCISV